MVGAKPKPAHLRLLHGNIDAVGHRAINTAEPTPSTEAPAPPRTLNRRARQIFKTVAGRIAEMGYCSASHTEALALLAQRLEEVERLTKVIECEGYTFRVVGVSGDTLIKPRPEVSQRCAAMRHAHSLLAEFGLTPSAATKVVVPGKQKRNSFDDL